ncbi:lysozyme inhibitor LprI family protein [Shewanella frigidimarina]|uniref:lysozyme inhibitor LprI family protein n=1 Tax=Shewanella frigidimarina TaxID=56812 RepID=UPI003D7B3107
MRQIIYILGLISVFSVQGASFDCSLARSSIEKTICANPDISKADEALTLLYSNIKNQAKYVNDLINDQRAWLKQRNACETDICILDKYQSRSLALNAWPETEAEKDKKLENCTDRPECWPEASAMNTGLTLVNSLNEASVKLKTKHDELIALLSDTLNYDGDKQPDSRVISALTAQQLSWSTYRADECELIGSLTGAGGSWPSTYANRCEVNLTEERLRRINSSIKCINKIPVEERWMEQARCLQQLAPLANKV